PRRPLRQTPPRSWRDSEWPVASGLLLSERPTHPHRAPARLPPAPETPRRSGRASAPDTATCTSQSRVSCVFQPPDRRAQDTIQGCELLLEVVPPRRRDAIRPPPVVRLDGPNPPALFEPRDRAVQRTRP